MSLAKALAIAAVSLQRLFRDRVSLFFVMALPLLITLVIGFTAFGAGASSALALGIADEDESALSRALVARLEPDPGLATQRHASADELRKAVRRGWILGGVLVPTGYDAGLRSGRAVQVEYVLNASRAAPSGLRTAVAAAVAAEGSRVRAASFAAAEAGAVFDAAYARVGESGARTVRVAAETVAAARAFPPGYSYPTAANVILFMFITSMAGASRLIQLRRLGIARRMLATPTTTGTVLAGEALGRLAIALFQGLFVLAVGGLVFGVRFGDPLAVAALVGAFALVATAVAMLFGTIFRTPDQAASIAPPVGIALGMLGGCMWPLEIVPPAMRTAGHLTPHAWAMDAWLALMVKGADIVAIAPSLLVLLAFAAVLLPLATWRLRRAIVA